MIKYFDGPAPAGPSEPDNENDLLFTIRDDSTFKKGPRMIEIEERGVWISVDDRLPGNNSPAIVTDGEITDVFVYLANHEDPFWEPYDDGGRWGFEPTHWMPLPTPPDHEG